MPAEGRNSWPWRLRSEDGEVWVVHPAVPSSLLVAKSSKVSAVAPKPLKQVTVMPECSKTPKCNKCEANLADIT